MTCCKCYYEWCWVCRGRYYSHHYNEFNIFGCPGAHYSTRGKCGDFLFKFLYFLAIPFIVILGPICFGIYAPCAFITECCRSCCCLCKFIIFLILLPITVGLGCAVSALAIGFVLAPAMLLQVYRMITIMTKGWDFCCCLRCLPCFRWIYLDRI
jgi:hypothetical protein